MSRYEKTGRMFRILEMLRMRRTDCGWSASRRSGVCF